MKKSFISDPRVKTRYCGAVSQANVRAEITFENNLFLLFSAAL